MEYKIRNSNNGHQWFVETKINEEWKIAKVYYKEEYAYAYVKLEKEKK